MKRTLQNHFRKFMIVAFLVISLCTTEIGMSSDKSVKAEFPKLVLTKHIDSPLKLQLSNADSQKNKSILTPSLRYRKGFRKCSCSY